MSLLKTQATLARLFTNTAARADFARDPAATVRAAGLEGSAAEALAALDANEIARYANALFAKRRQDVEQWLPLTARALGPEFARVLRGTFVEPPPGARTDALTLVAKLRTAASPPWIGALAVYEGEFVRAWRPGAFLSVRVFGWPAARIAARIAAGEPAEDVNAAWTVAIWLRPPGGRLQHWWRTLA